MYSYQEKNYKGYQKAKTQFEETQKVSEPDMAGMFKLSDQEFKITTINMLRALIENVDSMKEPKNLDIKKRKQ